MSSSRKDVVTVVLVALAGALVVGAGFLALRFAFRRPLLSEPDAAIADGPIATATASVVVPRRGLDPAVACKGAPPIPGPANDPVKDHLAAAKLAKAERDEPRVDPDVPFVAMQSTLMVLFSTNTTVGEANVALCTSDVRLLSTMSGTNIVTVQAKSAKDFSDLDDVRAKLFAQRCVESVALNMVGGIGGGEGDVKTGKRARPRRPLCTWASLEIAKAIAVEAPISCNSSRTMINGQEVDVAFARSDQESEVFAVVTADGGVFPVLAKGRHAGIPLTGKDHWTQRTRIGREAVQRFLYDTDRSAPEPGKRFDMREELRPQLHQLDADRRRCFNAHLVANPGSQGSVANLHFKVHPNGKVSDISLASSVNRDGSITQASPVAQCLTAALNALSFPPHDTDDIYELVETYPVYHSDY